MKTQYSDAIDKDFVVELAKRGEVHLLSSQVTLTAKSVAMEGLTVPDCATLQYIGIRRHSDDHFVALTFQFHDSAGIAGGRESHACSVTKAG